jgi:hypothetical protein
MNNDSFILLLYSIQKKNMMRALMFLTSLMLLTSLITSVTDEEFQKYMEKWGKVYTSAEKARRKAIF